MCGIFGFVGKRDRAQAIDLDVALKSLHHRGPDDRGTYFGVSKPNPDVACAFAHTRLSIIDLSGAGHQPMTTEDGRYTIVYNGEVYNFRDIRMELEQLGHRFRSNSDTEVILRSYIEWGKASVERLRGMFAFAIWDEERGSLYVARDRLGIKPFYYAQTATGFAFASEVRVLMNCGVAERHLSREGLNTYLAFGSAAEPFTMIENVVALPPGSHAEVDGNDARLESYWSLTDAAERGDCADGDLGPVVRKAIVSELEADVPVGVFLSGGVDSSSIIAIASKATTKPIHTFTATFDEPDYNEEKFAAEVASRYGCNHHQVHLSADVALAGLDGMLAALDQPSADGVNTYFVSKAARESGLSVVLSGLGGDEVFAGYPSFRSFGAMLLAGRICSPIARMFPVRGSAFGHRSRRRRKAVSLLRAGGDAAKAYAVIREMFSDAEIKALQPSQYRNGFAAASAVVCCGGNADPINLYSRLELANYLRNTLLRDTDAMSMANSLEVRVPFLDHVLLERLLRTPGRKKIAHGVNKPLLVGTAATLPATISRRPKMGFTLPLERWLRGAFEPRIHALFANQRSGAPGILDSVGVVKAWSAFAAGDRTMNYSRAWCLAAFVAWSRLNRVAV